MPIRINLFLQLSGQVKYFRRQEGIQRIKMPVDKQLLDMALIFNDGHLDPIKLADMVAMCQFILYRLHENGDINIPSSQEKE
jgi:hypothetical protein